jgi:hypothetical protein
MKKIGLTAIYGVEISDTEGIIISWYPSSTESDAVVASGLIPKAFAPLGAFFTGMPIRESGPATLVTDTVWAGTTPQPKAWAPFVPMDENEGKVPELPAFNPDDTAFDIIARTPAVADISDVQLAATLAPTPSPGYVSVAVVKEVATVKATVGFPLTQAEATNPVMKLAIESGVARSLGLGADLVKILSAGGVSMRRRLVDNLAIEFEIQSPAGADDAQAEILRSNLGAVAISGALVTHVQAEAALAGVLVASLKNMPVVLPTPTVEIASKSVTVFEQQPITVAFPLVVSIIIIVGISICLLLIIYLIVDYLYCRRIAATSATTKATPGAAISGARGSTNQDTAVSTKL